MKKRISVFCLLIFVIFSIFVRVYADTVPLVVLGTVKDIKDGIVTVTVDHVLGKTASDMIGKDIDVAQFTYTYCDEHSTSEFRNPKISDNIAISVLSADIGYELDEFAYKVDSNEYASCKIIVHEDIQDKDCIKELLEATCYIRSNAKVKDFEFDEDGRIYAVYPQTTEQCLQVVGADGTAIVNDNVPDTLPTVPPAAPEEAPHPPKDGRVIIALCIIVLGMVLGTAFGYVYILRKK